MGLGSSIGATRPITQDYAQFGGAGMQQPQQQMQMQQQQMPQFSAPEGLQFVEGATNDIYDRWASLQGVAKVFMKNYGIDVTEPDLTDPKAVEAFQIYQKGLADLYANVNLFKNSQRMFEAQQKYNAQFGTTFREGYDPSKQPFAMGGIGEVVQAGLAPEVDEVLKKFQQGFNSTDERDEANILLENLRTHAKQMINSTSSPAEREFWIRNLNAIQGATYDPTKDRDRWSRERIARQARTAKKQKDITYFNELWAGSQIGNPAIWALAEDDKGNPIYKDVNFEEGTGKWTYTTIERYDKETGEPIPSKVHSIDPNTDAGRLFFMRILNKYGNADLTYDMLRGGDAGTLVHRGGDAEPNYEPYLSDEFGKSVADDVVNLMNKREMGSFLNSVRKEMGEGKIFRLPAGIMLRKLVSGFRDNVKNKHVKGESFGNERVLGINYHKQGIDFETSDGLYHIPLSEESLSDLEGGKAAFSNAERSLKEFFLKNGFNTNGIKPTQQLIIVANPKTGKKVVIDNATGKAIRDATAADINILDDYTDDYNSKISGEKPKFSDPDDTIIEAHAAPPTAL